jgi:hypothetical protein|tara:strand:+ start:1452 stop:1646 length:195 start_codon:yes stop_codon:yes gene_type:complete
MPSLNSLNKIIQAVKDGLITKRHGEVAKKAINKANMKRKQNRPSTPSERRSLIKRDVLKRSIEK